MEAKYSYATAIPQWDWMIGAGVYATEVDKSMALAEAEAMASLKRSMITTVLTGLGLMVLVGAGAAWMVRRTVRPIRDTATAMEDIARGKGDLTRRLAVTTDDEVGELANQFNGVVARMQETLLEVRGSTRHVNRAADESALSSEELATRTEQAAANLQETSASLEEITATVNHSAESAGQANKLVAGTGKVAGDGLAVMGQVETTMGEISDSATRVNEIVTLIDGIAFPMAYLAYKKGHVPRPFAPLLKLGVTGAIVAIFSFGGIMLATRLDKVGEAAVLRETSVVFAALIAYLFWGEKVGPRRLSLMALIALGAVVVEMGG